MVQSLQRQMADCEQQYMKKLTDIQVRIPSSFPGLLPPPPPLVDCK